MTEQEHWRGRQWRVIPAGLETVDERYFIEADRLSETWDSGRPTWIEHMSHKTWLDLPDFFSAYCIALEFHGQGSAFSQLSLHREFWKAEARRARYVEAAEERRKNRIQGPVAVTRDVLKQVQPRNHSAEVKGVDYVD